MKDVLLLPDTAQDVQVGELRVGSIATVASHDPLQVLINIAMQDYRDEWRAANDRSILILFRNGASEAARGLRVCEDPGDIVRGFGGGNGS